MVEDPSIPKDYSTTTISSITSSAMVTLKFGFLKYLAKLTNLK